MDIAWYSRLRWIGLSLMGVGLILFPVAMVLWARAAIPFYAHPAPSPVTSTEDFVERRPQIEAEQKEYEGVLADTLHRMGSFHVVLFAGILFTISGGILLELRKWKLRRLQPGTGPGGTNPPEGSAAAGDADGREE